MPGCSARSAGARPALEHRAVRSCDVEDVTHRGAVLAHGEGAVRVVGDEQPARHDRMQDRRADDSSRGEHPGQLGRRCVQRLDVHQHHEADDEIRDSGSDREGGRCPPTATGGEGAARAASRASDGAPSTPTTRCPARDELTAEAPFATPHVQGERARRRHQLEERRLVEQVVERVVRRELDPVVGLRSHSSRHGASVISESRVRAM